MAKLNVAELLTLTGATLLCGDLEAVIEEYSFSSKSGGANTLFVPIKGERVDAHDYIRDAMEHGMRVTLTERTQPEPDTEGMTYLLVDNTRDALQRLGAAYRSRFSLPLLGITGSVGKTTTKEMMSAAMATGFRTLKTEGNKNGQLGVPVMMLELTEETEAAVIEMGMSLPGEMSRIAAVARPTCAVITNIGVSHIGNLHTQEAIRREKLCIINDMPQDGILLVNGDDLLLAALCPQAPEFAGWEAIEMYPETAAALLRLRIYAYGTKDWCDFRAEERMLAEDSSSFVFAYGEGREAVTLPVYGEHNVLNAAASLAAAYLCGISPKTAKQGLEAYRPLAMRGGMERLGNGVCLIDDTYNASPDSMKSGLQTLCAVSDVTRRVAVLADILELGEYAEACHRLVGTYVKDCTVDCLITVGTLAEYIAEEARTKEGVTVVSFATTEEALAEVPAFIRSGDAVLLKGSRGMGLDRIAAKLRERSDSLAICGCDH